MKQGDARSLPLLPCVDQSCLPRTGGTPPPLALLVRPPATQQRAEARRVVQGFRTFLAQPWLTRRQPGKGRLSERPVPAPPTSAPPKRSRPRRVIGVLAEGLPSRVKSELREQLGSAADVHFYSVWRPGCKAEQDRPNRFFRFRLEPALPCTVSGDRKALTHKSHPATRRYNRLVERELASMESKILPMTPGAAVDDDDSDPDLAPVGGTLVSHLDSSGRPTVLSSLHMFRKLSACASRIDADCLLEAVRRLKTPGNSGEIDLATFSAALAGVPYREREAGRYRLPFVSSYGSGARKPNKHDSEWEVVFRAAAWDGFSSSPTVAGSLLCQGLLAATAAGSPADEFLRFAFRAIAVARKVTLSEMRLVCDIYTAHAGEAGTAAAGLAELLSAAQTLHDESQGSPLHLHRISQIALASPGLLSVVQQIIREVGSEPMED